MIYKFFIGLLLIATIIYYFFCFLQIFGLIKFTKNEVSIPKMFIPFYYIIKKEPQEQPKPRVKRIIRPDEKLDNGSSTKRK